MRHLPTLPRLPRDGLYQSKFSNSFNLNVVLTRYSNFCEKSLPLIWLFYICFQSGEIFDTGGWPSRLLGSIPDRYGIPATLYGTVHHWDLKAWEVKRADYKRVLDPSSSITRLPTFIKTEDTATIQNVTRLRPNTKAHPFHELSLATLCWEGKNCVFKTWITILLAEVILL